MRKKVMGVGTYVPGKFVCRLAGTGRHTNEYAVWRGLLNRCYATPQKNGYAGCTVCDEWLDFQTFAEWLHANGYAEGKRLDKDILVQGNKFYSPSTCCLVPIYINSLITSKYSTANKDRGVWARVQNGRTTFVVRCVGTNGERVRLYGFNSEAEAGEAYRVKKKQVVKHHADRALTAGDINHRVYDALLAWEP